MRADVSKSLVNDSINIVTGSSKSNKIVNILWSFMKYLEVNPIVKDLMDDFLRLFVVLYLKSSKAVQLTILEDLENSFLLIKEQETKIFIDKKFTMVLPFAVIS